MKKKLFFLAAAAVALASCNNDVTIAENTTLVGSNEKQEISLSAFSTPTKRVIKRAPTEGTTFPTTYTMWVAAYQYGSPSGHDYFYDPATPTVMDHVPYTYASSNIWTGTPKQYWPLSNAIINFLAVTKESNVTPVFHSTSSFAQDVTVGLTDNSSTQHDLMYAVGQGVVEKTGNVVTVSDPDVDMVFKHALAWVDFYVKTADTYDDNKAIKLRGIKVNGSYSGGSLYLNNSANYNSNTTPVALTPAWSDRTPATPVPVAVPNWSTNYITNVSAEVAKGLLVVPHATENSISTFTIEYTLNGIDYDFEYTPASLKLAAGKHYIYNITFTLTEIRVEATVTDWEDGGTEYVDIPLFAAGTAGRNFDIPNTAGTYTFRVAGFTGASTPVLTESTLSTVITSATVEVTDYTSGVATVKFTVPANTTASAKNGGTIVLTDTGDGANASHNTTVTVNQAAGPAL